MRDVIVIGAGGGGPVVAKELAARGLDVLLLEAGGDFPNAEQNWSHLEIVAYNPASGVFRFGPADRTRPPWRRETPQNSAIFQVAGVGGTTLHYLANSPRAMPGAFAGYGGADADAYDTAHRFPFGYGALVPYYEWVEETLPVQTAAMGTKEQVFFNGAEAIGLPLQTGKDITRDAFRPQENAILQPQGTAGKTDDPKKLRFPQAKGCTFCGHCVAGCFQPLGAPRNLKAKRTTYVSYMPMALTADLWAAGRAVTLVPNAFAVNIGTEASPDGPVARRVTWRRTTDAALFTEDARVIVVAAGAIETPRLWLNSGLPDPNGWVGKGLTEHAFDWVVGVFPQDINSTHGPSSAARADFPGRGAIEPVGLQPAFGAFALAASDSGIAGLYDTGAGVGPQGADSVGRLVGPALKNALSDIDRTQAILILTDDDVEAQNRVELSTTAPPDEHGPIPRVIVNQRGRSARTKANRDFLVEKAVQIQRAAGATQVYRLNLPSILLHVHSSMRMGEDPASSVLDEHAEARAVRRLFIADNSALASSLGGPNPTLTTQALATRTAERIFQAYFDGDPWVGDERPVSSVDPQVTHAVLRRGL